MNTQTAALWHCLNCVGNEIEEHLFQLHRKALHYLTAAITTLNHYSVGLQLTLLELKDFIQEDRDRDCDGL